MLKIQLKQVVRVLNMDFAHFKNWGHSTKKMSIFQGNSQNSVSGAVQTLHGTEGRHNIFQNFCGIINETRGRSHSIVDNGNYTGQGVVATTINQCHFDDGAKIILAFVARK